MIYFPSSLGFDSTQIDFWKISRVFLSSKLIDELRYLQVLQFELFCIQSRQQIV